MGQSVLMNEPGTAVSTDEVRASYVDSELSKDPARRSNLPDRITDLPSSQIEELVKALSTERNNEMFRRLVFDGRSWRLTSAPTSSFLILAINAKVNWVLDKSSGRLDLLASLWQTGPRAEQEALRAEFRPYDGPPEPRRLVCVPHYRDSLRIVDGAHTAIGLAVSGKLSLATYVGDLPRAPGL
jgi:hypothetical protein